jgi:hypothetical protein
VLRCQDGQPSEDLTWRILPDDRTPSFVEIWLDRTEGQGAVQCDVAAPGCAGPAAPLDIGFDAYADLMLDGRPVARCYHSRHAPFPDLPDRAGRQRIVLVAQPTLPDGSGKPYARPGDWTLRLRPPGRESVRADACVQRDDTPFGYRQRGRQSYFADGAYEDHDPSGRLRKHDDGPGLITRRGTMNAYTCGWQAFVVGSVTRFGAWPPAGSGGVWRGTAETPYSGKGPTPRRLDANQLRPTDESLAHRGVYAAGTYSGSTVLMSGTSLAAPAAARAAAEALLPEARAALAARPQPPARVMP